MRIHLLYLLLCLHTLTFAQKPKKTTTAATPQPSLGTTTALDVSNLGLSFRSIGPYRGGRSAAVTGVAGKPNLFYFGSTGGGVWRTQDGGRSWENISDGYFGGSIGAIEVSPSDNNVMYVGGGEKTVRGNVSYGYGIWKSEDAGKSWKSLGLADSRHVPRIRVHPTNPDVVYAAVLGDLFKSSETRGIYRSRDGGKTWQRVLFVNADAGAIDLCMDPTNPRILYASFWRVRRTPHSLSSGGWGSGLWKSTDGGDTWIELSKNEGFPKDTLGIIGVTVSPARPERVWAMVESQSGGLMRSDDGGKTWAKLNEDRSLRQRAWYYTRVYADTKDEDIVYVLNVQYHKSKDGGKTFASKAAPHGDHHDLWIAPEDPRRIIIGDDGGAQITVDGGETWSTYHNQPTAQYYRVTTDNAFPFRILVAQQDNSALRVAHRTDGFAITEKDWDDTAGGESGHIVADPTNSDVVYGGQYHGFLTRLDHGNNTERAINVWPEDNMGHGAVDAKYRFQWNFPLFFSPHDPKKLYAASNHLHLTTNEGQSWETISPDLTTNDRARQASSGGPITQDNTGVEYYCTIFAAAESPRVRDLLWTGSDDGLVHVSRNGGKTWANVTPPALPKWTMINSVEPDPHTDGGCYIAATAYKLGDYKPYLFRTKDYGATWTLITQGIEAEHFTRVVRADPQMPNLLYAGTETGLYISLNDGDTWQRSQLNLPIVPITDMTLKAGKLIVATQGRSLWLLDDVTPLHQLMSMPAAQRNNDFAQQKAYLFKPAPAYRMAGGAGRASKLQGENHPKGSMIHFYLPKTPTTSDTVTLAILESDGDTVKVFSTRFNEAKNLSPQQASLKDVKKGGNRFVWDLHYADAERFDGMVLWSYNLQGPRAVPGTYRVRLTAFGQSQEQPLVVVPDPRSTSKANTFTEQFEFTQSISGKLTEAHRAIKGIRALRSQLSTLKERLPAKSAAENATTGVSALRAKIASMDSTITKVEEALYQTKNRSSQDPLNFPVRLNDKLANLMGQSVRDDFPPTEQAKAVRQQLFEQTDAQLRIWQNVRTIDLAALNRLVRESTVDWIQVRDK